MKTFYRATRALVILANIAAPMAVNSTAFAATPAPSAHGLPAPQISKALDALLLPITKSVIKKFKLAKGEHGVFVLSVKPGGVADKQGIKPGDIISEIHGHKVHKPIDVDVAVKRDLKTGNSNIAVNLFRAGAPVAVAAVITTEEYNEAVSVSEVSTWESETTESFSYSEYVSEETSSVESSYESEETTVDEEMTQEESSSDEETSEEVSEDNDSGDDAGDDSSDGDSDGD